LYAVVDRVQVLLASDEVLGLLLPAWLDTSRFAVALVGWLLFGDIFLRGVG
jgi:hypothetical protein